MVIFVRSVFYLSGHLVTFSALWIRPTGPVRSGFGLMDPPSRFWRLSQGLGGDIYGLIFTLVKTKLQGFLTEISNLFTFYYFLARNRWNVQKFFKRLSNFQRFWSSNSVRYFFKMMWASLANSPPPPCSSDGATIYEAETNLIPKHRIQTGNYYNLKYKI